MERRDLIIRARDLETLAREILLNLEQTETAATWYAVGLAVAMLDHGASKLRDDCDTYTREKYNPIPNSENNA